MARYMRDQFAFYGVPSPAVRSITRAAFAGVRRPEEDDVAGLALACWSRPEREWQYVACDMLARAAPRCSARLLVTVEHLIVTKSWWDTVDALAANVVGSLVFQHPSLVGMMDRWIDEENIWLARTALLHQLRYKNDTDADRLFAYCLRRAPDREFFLRKAIGWALREYSKWNRAAVAAFVAEHEHELSPLSRREALRRIARG